MLDGAADHGGEWFGNNDSEDIVLPHGSTEDALEAFARIEQCLTFRRTDRHWIFISGAKKSGKTLADVGFRQTLPEPLIDVAEFVELLNFGTGESVRDGMCGACGWVFGRRQDSLWPNSLLVELSGDFTDLFLPTAIDGDIQCTEQTMAFIVVSESCPDKYNGRHIDSVPQRTTCASMASCRSSANAAE